MNYQGCFGGLEDVVNEFKISEQELNFIDQIIYAHYDIEGYDGSAFVLFRGKDGIIYEVNGGHCSCYGLEEQWGPEPIVLKELKNRIQHSSYLNKIDLEEILNTLD